MKYYNLTARQARHFIDTGKLLIIDKIEPQPEGQLVGTVPDGFLFGDWRAFPVRCPFARVGETTKFREPWDEPLDGFIEYQADHMSEPEARDDYTPSSRMTKSAIRLSGKCVKVEARKIDSVRVYEIAQYYLAHPSDSSLQFNENWNKDNPNFPYPAWAWFATFERITE